MAGTGSIRETSAILSNSWLKSMEMARTTQSAAFVTVAVQKRTLVMAVHPRQVTGNITETQWISIALVYHTFVNDNCKDSNSITPVDPNGWAKGMRTRQNTREINSCPSTAKQQIANGSYVHMHAVKSLKRTNGDEHWTEIHDRWMVYEKLGASLILAHIEMREG